jgi:hypothetical protein
MYGRTPACESAEVVMQIGQPQSEVKADKLWLG